MARMKLYKNTRLGGTEIYPIYELTYSELTALTGFTLDDTNDQVGTDVNKYRRWHVINNEVYKGIDANIPRQENQPGNIIPFWHRYRNVINGDYYLEPDVLASFAGIEQGIRPDDWGTNPNYITMGIKNSDVPSGHNVAIPTCVNIRSSFESSTTYYEDTKRTQLRMFFNEKGNSFSVCKASYYNYNRWAPITYGVAIFPAWFSSTQNQPQYSFTNSQGTVFNERYHLEYSEPGWDYDWNYWNGSTNCQMVFIHYVENGTTDFYGVAIIQMNNMSETSEPVGIYVIAWDAAWWEGSIIGGGGGSGQWTHDGPTSYVQGGRGTFQAPSDNHGDADGTSTGAIADNWSAKGMGYSEGYNKYLIPLRETSPGVYRAPAFKEMVNNLTDPSFLQGFENLFYNPISAVITCALIPRAFAPATVGVDYIHAAGLDLTSENAAAIYEQTYKRVHIGSVSVESFSDSFADFDNTAVYIHLPYVGNFQLDTAAVMEGELSVDYLIDYFTNDITAIVWTRDKFGNYNYRYEWKGNCGKPMPLTQIIPASSRIAAAMIPTAISSGASLIGGALSAHVAANQAVNAAQPSIMENSMAVAKSISVRPSMQQKLAGEFAAGASRQLHKQTFWGSFLPTAATATGTAASSMAGAALSMGQQMLSSNANGGSVSSPVNTQCYLAIVRPQWSAPEDYGKRFGYPSDISGTINVSDTEAGDPFTNFLSVRAILLDGLTCLPEEKAEIEQLMVAGVYVSND